MPRVQDDGVTHLNIYSQGKTKLGRFLSNFANCPIITEDGPFHSIEGYWYWLSCKDDRLRTLSGYEAKHVGRELGGKDWSDEEEFKRKICAALEAKLTTSTANSLIKSNPDLIKLPFKHYYVYGKNKKVVEPKEGKWIIQKIKSFISTHYT